MSKSREVLRDRFKMEAFRPHQEEVVETIAKGRDVLLVMSTGGGKSLCFQVPGIMRGGTTLVVSPLIALIQDQVEKLAAAGFQAEALHSGRSREEQRAIVQRHQRGELDFLYCAPERMGSELFTKALVERRPSLVAIDEAHCVSHWGHDFRPDYIELGPRLRALRPAPIAAFTATATPRVQEDIRTGLGLENPVNFIRGFRRTNLGLNLWEVSKMKRLAATRGILEAAEARPAIVYTGSRKRAEDWAKALGKEWRTGAYHAGMEDAQKDRVQRAYAEGRIEVVCATIAFGMGVDKADVRTVIHSCLPDSLEGYYQEVGRGGRDGLPAEAYLLWDDSDEERLEWILGKNYPEPEILSEVHGALRESPLSLKDVVSRVTIQTVDEVERVVQNALEKLGIHGGAVRTGSDRRARWRQASAEGWLASYAAQRLHRQEQAARVLDFARSAGCRMVHLVSHFGDKDDSEPCGRCDSCTGACKPALAAPTKAVRKARPPKLGEADVDTANEVLAVLRRSRRGKKSEGRVHSDGLGGTPPRPRFRHIVDRMVDGGYAKREPSTYKGRKFNFLLLTEAGRRARLTAADLGIEAA